MAALAVRYSMQERCIVVIAAEALREKFGGYWTNFRIGFKYLTKYAILRRFD